MVAFIGFAEKSWIMKPNNLVFWIRIDRLFKKFCYDSSKQISFFSPKTAEWVPSLAHLFLAAPVWFESFSLDSLKGISVHKISDLDFNSYPSRIIFNSAYKGLILTEECKARFMTLSEILSPPLGEQHLGDILRGEAGSLAGNQQPSCDPETLKTTVINNASYFLYMESLWRRLRYHTCLYRIGKKK